MDVFDVVAKFRSREFSGQLTVDIEVIVFLASFRLVCPFNQSDFVERHLSCPTALGRVKKGENIDMARVCRRLEINRQPRPVPVRIRECLNCTREGIA